MRTGLVAKKLGMTRILLKDKSVAGTLLQLENPVVVDHKTTERDGYDAVVIGVRNAKPKHVAKQQKGLFAKAGVPAKRKLVEFRVAKENFVPVGSEILAGHFVEGQFVDVQGVSIGRGFAGVMKRHNFAGLEATHGVSVSHRSHGSTGQRQDPGRVFKNKKMAGHMGSVNVTAQNLEILQTDDAEGLILVKGSIPGAEGSFVILRDAVKIMAPQNVPLPAKIKQSGAAAAAPAEAQATENKAEGQ
jgi:large subunit ribosomal protein L3